MFNEDNTTEKLILDTIRKNGWKYIPAEDLPRRCDDVLVEKMVKEALIRLNPEIAEKPSRADEIIYKLRAIINTVQSHDLIRQNEIFEKLVFQETPFHSVKTEGTFQSAFLEPAVKKILPKMNTS